MKAFGEMKAALATNCIDVHPNYKRPFQIYTNAINYRLATNCIDVHPNYKRPFQIYTNAINYRLVPLLFRTEIKSRIGVKHLQQPK